MARPLDVDRVRHDRSRRARRRAARDWIAIRSHRDTRARGAAHRSDGARATNASARTIRPPSRRGRRAAGRPARRRPPVGQRAVPVAPRDPVDVLIGWPGAASRAAFAAAAVGRIGRTPPRGPVPCARAAATGCGRHRRRAFTRLSKTEARDRPGPALDADPPGVAPKADVHRLDARPASAVAVPVDRRSPTAARRVDRRAARIVRVVHEAALAGDDPPSIARTPREAPIPPCDPNWRTHRRSVRSCVTRRRGADVGAMPRVAPDGRTPHPSGADRRPIPRSSGIERAMAERTAAGTLRNAYPGPPIWTTGSSGLVALGPSEPRLERPEADAARARPPPPDQDPASRRAVSATSSVTANPTLASSG